MFKCWIIYMEECFNIWIFEYWWYSTSDYFDYLIISKVFNVWVLEHLYGRMFQYLNSWIRYSASDYFDYFYNFQCLSVGAFIWRNVSILDHLNTVDVQPVIIWLFWLFLKFSMFKCWSICMEECFNIWILKLFDQWLFR